MHITSYSELLSPMASPKDRIDYVDALAAPTESLASKLEAAAKELRAQVGLIGKLFVSATQRTRFEWAAVEFETEARRLRAEQSRVAKLRPALGKARDAYRSVVVESESLAARALPLDVQSEIERRATATVLARKAEDAWRLYYQAIEASALKPLSHWSNDADAFKGAGDTESIAELLSRSPSRSALPDNGSGLYQWHPIDHVRASARSLGESNESVLAWAILREISIPTSAARNPGDLEYCFTQRTTGALRALAQSSSPDVAARARTALSALESAARAA